MTLRFGCGREGSRRLKDALADYPGWSPPHRGTVLRLPSDDAPVLTATQTRENFEAQRDVVPTRIAVLRRVPAVLGLVLDDAYMDAAGFVRRLHPLLLAELLALYRRNRRRPAGAAGTLSRRAGYRGASWAGMDARVCVEAPVHPYPDVTLRLRRARRI